ncbi:hypothetical protein D9M71_833600 [compost metagenome]
MPVQGGGQFFQLFDAVARGVQAADHRAHAGAGDGIDVHALFLQCLEHADVRQAPGGTTGKHQADLGPELFGGKRREGGERQQKAEQQAAHRESQTVSERPLV